MNPIMLAKLASQISHLLPADAGRDMKENAQQLLARQLHKLDLVSRDEFEAQQAVLLRTREKLTSLEKQLQALEEKLGSS
ncbi:MAG: accessory factor UbiK family protein [Bermanella sp.]